MYQLQIALLIPLIVKDRRMFFAGFSLVPYYLWMAYINQDFFGVVKHYITGVGLSTHDYVYTLYTLEGWISLFIGLGIPFLAAMTLPLFLKFKKYPEYCVLLVCTVIYAWGSGLGITHLSSMLYVCVLVFPLVVHEFNLYEKFSKWLDMGAKKMAKSS